MALHLPTGPLKTSSELKLVPICEPSTYQPICQQLTHCTIRMLFLVTFMLISCMCLKFKQTDLAHILRVWTVCLLQ